MTLFEVARGDLAAAGGARSCATTSGTRPVYGGTRRSSRTIRTGATCILFYEYFHGDNGAGLGASHQTGWTGLVARLMDIFGRLDATADVDISRDELIRRTTHEQAVGAAGPAD